MTARADLAAAISKIPASVLNGGVVRAVAWKAAAFKALKMLKAGASEEKCEDALRSLRAIEITQDIESLAGAGRGR